ncbi:MAG: AmmeMemoRadiSam system protein B [Aminivibrio sp.]|jgi:AmmeMemoRadiSam system protein B
MKNFTDSQGFWPVSGRALPGLSRGALGILFLLLGLAAGAWAAPPVRGGIVPHHDVAIEMIEDFYHRVASEDVKRVWLFSPDHFRQARSFAPYCPDDWATPFRTIKADEEASRILKDLSVSGPDSALFEKEHGITIHIPYVARHFPNATVLPMVIGLKTPDLALLELKKAILKIAGESDLFILSMDFSHYKTPEAMAREDEKTLPVLAGLHHSRTGEIDVDAGRAAALLLLLMKDLGVQEGTVIRRSDISEILGRRVESGTSYGTILYERDRNSRKSIE